MFGAMPPFVTYALLAGCAALFVFGFWLDGRKAGRLARFRRAALVLQIGAIVAAYALLRPGRGDDGKAVIASSVASGKPVLIDMYSNF